MDGDKFDGTADELQRLAEIRARHRSVYRPTGTNLQVREDLNFVLNHLDSVIEQFQQYRVASFQ